MRRQTVWKKVKEDAMAKTRLERRERKRDGCEPRKLRVGRMSKTHEADMMMALGREGRIIRPPTRGKGS